MAKYPKVKQAPPPIYTAEHFKDWEAALHQLAIANHHIAKCERCGMPVEAYRQECDQLCDFFRGLQQEYRDPATGPTGAL